MNPRRLALVLDAVALVVTAALSRSHLATVRDVSRHVAEARAVLPEALRRPVVLEVALLPASAPSIETSPGRATLLVAGHQAGSLDRTVWAHELAHVVAAGARPEGSVGARLMRAVDEGVADFVAATFTGSSRVGSAALGEARDLAHAPFVGDSEWAYLGMPSAPWDAHRLGWALAAEMFREPSGAELATDAVLALADPRPFPEVDEPRAILAEWIARCPSRSQYSLRRAVDRWTPAELLAYQESP